MQDLANLQSLQQGTCESWAVLSPASPGRARPVPNHLGNPGGCPSPPGAEDFGLGGGGRGGGCVALRKVSRAGDPTRLTPQGGSADSHHTPYPYDPRVWRYGDMGLVSSSYPHAPTFPYPHTHHSHRYAGMRVCDSFSFYSTVSYPRAPIPPKDGGLGVWSSFLIPIIPPRYRGRGVRGYGGSFRARTPILPDLQTPIPPRYAGMPVCGSCPPSSHTPIPLGYGGLGIRGYGS